MYNGSEFDGAAAFSGGGFMPSQATQNTDPQRSTHSKNHETKTLTTLTVKQISTALLPNDDKVNFLIDGVDVNTVKLVGMVCNKAESVTDVSFVLDDGTGQIDCIRWVNDPLDTKEMNAIMEGMYVRAHGQLKGFQGKKQLVVYVIKPVTDFDEITHHFVECMYVHSHNTKLMKQQASSSNQAHMPTSAVNIQTYQTAPPNQFVGQNVGDGVQGIEKQILDYLQQPASLVREQGVHQDELASQLRIPVDQIIAVLHYLGEDGLVYSAIDDVHFKSAVNG